MKNIFSLIVLVGTLVGCGPHPPRENQSPIPTSVVNLQKISDAIAPFAQYEAEGLYKYTLATSFVPAAVENSLQALQGEELFKNKLEVSQQFAIATKAYNDLSPRLQIDLIGTGTGGYWRNKQWITIKNLRMPSQYYYLEVIGVLKDLHLTFIDISDHESLNEEVKTKMLVFSEKVKNLINGQQEEEGLSYDGEAPYSDYLKAATSEIRKRLTAQGCVIPMSYNSKDADIVVERVRAAKDENPDLAIQYQKANERVIQFNKLFYEILSDWRVLAAKEVLGEIYFPAIIANELYSKNLISNMTWSIKTMEYFWAECTRSFLSDHRRIENLLKILEKPEICNLN